jgi:hypothetical protein
MWHLQQFLRLKRLQCAGYTVRVNDSSISSVPPKESTGTRFQRKKFHRKGYIQMGEEETHSFDPDTEMEDGSKEGR